jgi:hypothetical protein
VPDDEMHAVARLDVAAHRFRKLQLLGHEHACGALICIFWSLRSSAPLRYSLMRTPTVL